MSIKCYDMHSHTRRSQMWIFQCRSQCQSDAWPFLDWNIVRLTWRDWQVQLTNDSTLSFCFVSLRLLFISQLPRKLGPASFLASGYGRAVESNRHQSHLNYSHSNHWNECAFGRFGNGIDCVLLAKWVHEFAIATFFFSNKLFTDTYICTNCRNTFIRSTSSLQMIIMITII